MTGTLHSSLDLSNTEVHPGPEPVTSLFVPPVAVSGSDPPCAICNSDPHCTVGSSEPPGAVGGGDLPGAAGDLCLCPGLSW